MTTFLIIIAIATCIFIAFSFFLLEHDYYGFGLSFFIMGMTMFVSLAIASGTLDYKHNEEREKKQMLNERIRHRLFDKRSFLTPIEKDTIIYKDFNYYGKQL